MRISDDELKLMIAGYVDVQCSLNARSFLDLRDAREAIREILKWDWQYMVAEELAFDDEGRRQFCEDIDRLRKQVTDGHPVD